MAGTSPSGRGARSAANYTLQYVGVHHEELMRGSAAGTKRAQGTGTLLDAIKLRQLPATVEACPAPLPSLADQKKATVKAATARRGGA
jgi:hypothetical protein